jgi:hypothetical protein
LKGASSKNYDVMGGSPFFGEYRDMQVILEEFQLTNWKMRLLPSRERLISVLSKICLDTLLLLVLPLASSKLEIENVYQSKSVLRKKFKS